MLEQASISSHHFFSFHFFLHVIHDARAQAGSGNRNARVNRLHILPRRIRCHYSSQDVPNYLCWSLKVFCMIEIRVMIIYWLRVIQSIKIEWRKVLLIVQASPNVTTRRYNDICWVIRNLNVWYIEIILWKKQSGRINCWRNLIIG